MAYCWHLCLFVVWFPCCFTMPARHLLLSSLVFFTPFTYFLYHCFYFFFYCFFVLPYCVLIPILSYFSKSFKNVLKVLFNFICAVLSSKLLHTNLVFESFYDMHPLLYIYLGFVFHWYHSAFDIDSLRKSPYICNSGLSIRLWFSLSLINGIDSNGLLSSILT